jgi:hypothetical protein
MQVFILGIFIVFVIIAYITIMLDIIHDYRTAVLSGMQALFFVIVFTLPAAIALVILIVGISQQQPV